MELYELLVVNGLSWEHDYIPSLWLLESATHTYLLEVIATLVSN